MPMTTETETALQILAKLEDNLLFASVVVRFAL
jgi:hypothetical protein